MAKIKNLITLSLAILALTSITAFAGGNDEKPKKRYTPPKKEERHVRQRPRLEDEREVQVVEQFQVVPVLYYSVQYISCVNPYNGCVYHQPVTQWFVQYVRVPVGQQVIYNEYVKPYYDSYEDRYPVNEGVRDYRELDRDRYVK
jgi:hypothetical protein